MSGNFFSTVSELSKGQTLEELDESISQVVAAVRDTRKPGKLILELTIRPPRKGEGNHLSVEADVRMKQPKHDRAETIFFPLSDGRLSRQDPNQRALDLRPVPSRVPNNVDTSTGELVAN